MPNVSFCEDNRDVHYNPYEEPDTRLIATFSGSGRKRIYAWDDIDFYVSGETFFSAIEIDGTDVSIQELDEAQGYYEFSVNGEHVVKYTLKDPTRIDSYMFYTANAKTVIIPNTVTTIGHDAFLSSNDLTTVIIPNTVTIIENYAFLECTLPSVTIPSSVTSIGVNGFQGCTSLSSVTVEATTPPTLGSGVFDTNASGRKIYVPSGSVDAYKVASNWSTYASDIEAIQ